MFARSLVLVVGSVIAAATFVPDLATRYLDTAGKAPEEAKVEKASAMEAALAA